ncbi:TPA: hypothetical protein ACH3X3_007047 [Trebouxia sp. C0006]
MTAAASSESHQEMEHKVLTVQNYKAQEMAAFDHTTPAGSHAWAAWSSAAREMGCLKWLELIVETKQVLDWMLQIS